MNPAFSVVAFTTAAGAAQGLVVSPRAGAPRRRADGAVVRSLQPARGGGPARRQPGACSFLHLGRPARAWRAVMMWRTSWLSREVIILPAFIALVAGWWAGLARRRSGRRGPAAARRDRAGRVALVLHGDDLRVPSASSRNGPQPLTIVNFVLLGLSSGAVLASALAALAGETRALALAAPTALVVTLAAWAARGAAWRRNAAIRHRSTLQSATRIQFGAPGADVDGHVGRVVQHARVLPSRVARSARADQGHRHRFRLRAAGRAARGGHGRGTAGARLRRGVATVVQALRV